MNSTLQTLTLYWLQGNALIFKDLATPAFPCVSLLWEEIPAPIDEGLPSVVVDCLSQAFCAVGPVCFVSDSDLPQSHQLGGNALGDSHSMYFSRLLQLPSIRKKPFHLVQTHHPCVAKLTFEISAWHFAPCQVIFILQADSPHLALSDTQIQSCILHGVTEAMHEPMKLAGVQICITLGHDGAWLNVHEITPHALTRIKSALQKQSLANDIAFIEQIHCTKEDLRQSDQHGLQATGN